MKNKGITLIALVITIVIMLILVAATVNYGIKSGLLSKAKSGGEKYTYKEEEDEIGAIKSEYLIDEKTEKTEGNSLEEYIKIALGDKLEEEPYIDGEFLIITYKNGNIHRLIIQDTKKDETYQAGLYETGHAGESSYLIKSWDEIKEEYPEAFTCENKVMGREFQEKPTEMGYESYFATWDENYDECTTYLIGDLVLPQNIIEIGRCAFGDCYGLTAVYFPAELKTIGEDAFNCCENLVIADIPEKVISIGDGAFSGTKLINVTIPKGVTEIKGDTFCGCENLVNLVIPEGVTVIGSQAFEDCISLVSVILPSTLKRIDYYAFVDCTSLTSVTLPRGTDIDEYAFRSPGEINFIYF